MQWLLSGSLHSPDLNSFKMLQNQFRRTSCWNARDRQSFKHTRGHQIQGHYIRESFRLIGSDYRRNPRYTVIAFPDIYTIPCIFTWVKVGGQSVRCQTNCFTEIGLQTVGPICLSFTALRRGQAANYSLSQCIVVKSVEHTWTIMKLTSISNYNFSTITRLLTSKLYEDIT